MATNKKGSGTSKTAHVMNLLNKHRDVPPADPQEETPAVDTAPEPSAEVPAASPADTVQQDAQAAEQIKSALEDALAQEAAPKPHEPAPKPEPVSKPEPIPEPEPVPEPVLPPESVPPEPIPAPVPDPIPVPEPVSPPVEVRPPEPVSPPVEVRPPEPVSPPVEIHPPEQPPLDLPVSPVPPVHEAVQEQEEDEDDVTYVNVMQLLVEEKAEKYMRLYGLCCCPRCVIDVKALALNNLPPKYVVMHKGDMVPRITVYEGRYNAVITAQLMQACTSVQKAPHHHRT